MKSEFTNIVAHELKTPIVPIKAFLSIMQKEPKKYGLNKKAEEYIDICLRSADRLESLVQDVLHISRLEAGEMKFEMQDVDLVPILTVLTDLSSMVKEKEISLKLNIPKKLPLLLKMQ